MTIKMKLVGQGTGEVVIEGEPSDVLNFYRQMTTQPRAQKVVRATPLVQIRKRKMSVPKVAKPEPWWKSNKYMKGATQMNWQNIMETFSPDMSVNDYILEKLKKGHQNQEMVDDLFSKIRPLFPMKYHGPSKTGMSNSGIRHRILSRISDVRIKNGMKIIVETVQAPPESSLSFPTKEPEDEGSPSIHHRKMMDKETIAEVLGEPYRFVKQKQKEGMEIAEAIELAVLRCEVHARKKDWRVNKDILKGLIVDNISEDHGADEDARTGGD